MKAKRGGIGALAVGGLVLLAVGAATAEARGHPQDEMYRLAGLEGRRLATVAVLPAVSIVGNEIAEEQVAQGWVTLYDQTKVRWVPAREVSARLTKCLGAADDLEAEIRAEIWRRGAVNPATAIRLARLLGVDAVLSVRIDRWEIADGGRGMVEMNAVLTGADGQRLWSICGVAGHGSARPSRYWNHMLERVQGEENRRLCKAFYTLLARWAPAVPMGFETDKLPVLLAGGADE